MTMKPSWPGWRLALGSLLCACLPVATSAWAAEGGCAIVFGHGRNLSDDDTRANTAWNEVNRAFNAVVASELGAAGLRVVAMVAPVEVTDLAAIIATVTSRAVREGCATVVETTIFADEAERLLVVRLRAYPLLRGATSAPPAPRIGEPTYSDQQQYQLTQRTLDRLAPATLGRQMAAGYLGQGVGQAAH